MFLLYLHVKLNFFKRKYKSIFIKYIHQVYSSIIKTSIMGQAESTKRMTKEDRQAKEFQKQKVVTQQVQKIHQAQEDLWNQAKSGSLVSYQDFHKMMQIGETAKAQLSKGGATLTKSDLIAVIIRLDPSVNMKKLQMATVSDLNTMIRCIIYNVDTSFVNTGLTSSASLVGSVQTSKEIFYIK